MNLDELIDQLQKVQRVHRLKWNTPVKITDYDDGYMGFTEVEGAVFDGENEETFVEIY